MGPDTKDYPALGRRGLEAARRAIREVTRLPASSTLEETQAGYTLLFDRVYDWLARVLGPLGVQAVVKRAIGAAAHRSPILTTVVVTESRIVLDGMLAQGPEPRELRAAADDLFCSTLDVVAALIGLDLLQPVLDRMRNPVRGATSITGPGVRRP